MTDVKDKIMGLRLLGGGWLPPEKTIGITTLLTRNNGVLLA